MKGTILNSSAPKSSAASIRDRVRRLESGGLRTFVTPDPLVLAKAKGAWLTDVDGHRYLDFGGSFAVTTTGHGHPTVVAAIQAQADNLIHCPSAYPSELRAEFLEAVESICAPLMGDLAIMPAMSGAMANEMAISLVRHQRPGCELISFSGSYFGRSMGAVTLDGKAQYRQALGLGPGAHFAPFPYPLRHGADATIFTMNYLEALTGSGGGAGQIGGVFLEPIQGNGGVVIPPADFMPRLREFCDRIGALLVVDEIQSGCGRSGAMWATQHTGVVPDLMTIGKGIGGNMGVAALVGKRHLMEWKPDAYSSTFMTNHIGLAASVAAIKVMGEEGLVERSRMLGEKYLPILQERLLGLAQVTELRGKGLWFAIELKTPQLASTAVGKLRENGVIMGGGGYSGNVIKAAPALNIDEVDLSEGLNKVCDIVRHLQ